MHAPKAVIASALFAFCTATATVASAQSTDQPPQAVCSPVAALPIGVVAAYASPIDDVRTREFMETVSQTNTSKRGPLLARAKKASYRSDGEIAANIARQCLQSALRLRVARFTYQTAYRWQDGSLSSIEPAMYGALGALLLGDSISAPARDAALAVFGVDVNALDALAAAPAVPFKRSGKNVPADPCNAPAFATNVFTPDYPVIARQNDAAGIVPIGVDLDEHGLIKELGLEKDAHIPTDPAHQALIDVSTVVAGASSYAPGFADCKPIADRYLFRAEFQTSSFVRRF